MVTSATFRTVVAPTGVDKGFVRRLYWILCAVLEWTCFVFVIVSLSLSTDFDSPYCLNAGPWRYLVLSLGLSKALVMILFLRSRWCLWCLCPRAGNENQRTLSSLKIVCAMSLHFVVAVMTTAYEIGIPGMCWDALGITNRATLNILLWGSFASIVAYVFLVCVNPHLSNGRHKLSEV